MSRAEIEAAARALRRSPRRSVIGNTSGECLGPAAVSAAVAPYAARSAALGPFYRFALVAQLRDAIAQDAYHRPAAAIVEQLLGRLTAAALID